MEELGRLGQLGTPLATFRSELPSSELNGKGRKRELCSFVDNPLDPSWVSRPRRRLLLHNLSHIRSRWQILILLYVF